MSTSYCRLLVENRSQIEDELDLRLSAAGALHGHLVDGNRIRLRIVRLMDAFLEALGPRPDALWRHVEEITAARIHEGMSLHELQLAFQVLEDRSWRLIVESVPMAGQVSCLARITTVIGEAKDRIAHVLLHGLEAIEAERDFMSRNRAARSVGTTQAVTGEDDLNWQTGTPHPHASLV